MCPKILIIKKKLKIFIILSYYTLKKQNDEKNIFNMSSLSVYTYRAIGSGGFGTVYDSEIDGENCACKVTHREKSKHHIGIMQPIEPIIMRHMRYQYVNYSKTISRSGDKIYIPSERAQYSLAEICGHQFVHNPHAVGIIYNILQSVHFFHQNNLIHCDIKPSNILYYQRDHIRLTDFSITRNAKWNCNGVIGTSTYRAPEIARGLHFSYPSDVWSLGCTIYELISGEKLIKGLRNDRTDKDMYHSTTNEYIEKYIDDRIMELLRNNHYEKFFGIIPMIRGMLRIDPNMRPATIELLSNNAFENYRHENTCQYIPHKTKSSNQRIIEVLKILQAENCPPRNRQRIADLAKYIFHIAIYGEKWEDERILAKTCLCLSIKLYYGYFPKSFTGIIEYLKADLVPIEECEFALIERVNIIPAIIHE